MSFESVMPSNHLILCHPFSSCPQSFPASGPFPMSQLFTSGGHSTGVSALALVLAMNIQGWFSLGLTGLIYLLSKELSRVFSSITVRKHKFFGTQPSSWSGCHIHTWLLEKPQLWLYSPFPAKWCLCFIILCLGFYSFSSREQVSSKLMAAVTVHSDFGDLESKKIKSVTVFHVFHFYLPWNDGPRCHDLSFMNVEF